MHTPNVDAERRREKIEEFAANLRSVTIDVTQGQIQPSYVCYAIIVSSEPLNGTPEGIGTPIRKFLRQVCVDPPGDDEVLAIGGYRAELGDRHIGVVAACPPGSLRAGASVGFVTDSDAT